MLALQVTLTTSPGLLKISAGAGDTLKLGPALACKTSPLSQHSRNIQQQQNTRTDILYSRIYHCSDGLEQQQNSQWTSTIETSKDQRLVEFELKHDKTQNRT